MGGSETGADRREVGRVIFRKDDPVWTVLTLKCHVDNVTTLAKAWSFEAAYLQPMTAGTREKVIQAAKIHDDAKPKKFRLTYQGFRSNPPEWGYSFAGHRFEVPSTGDLYVDELVRLHHEYSVDGITEAMAKLRLDEQNRMLYQNFPLDLYALEMADQIEATVARAAVDAVDPEGRVFMDFDFDTVDREQRIYRIDPFPFNVEARGSIQLTIECARIETSAAIRQKVESGNVIDARKLRNQLRDDLVEALQTAPLVEREVTLCPWAN